MSCLKTKETLVWALLVAMTLLSWYFSSGESQRVVNSSAVAILVIAFVKVRFVVMHFMEVGTAARPLRLMLEAWIALVLGLVLVFYLTDSPTWLAPITG
ncbi:MAG: cytochrome C oxidase subunit IV family protein [bacterium]